MDQNKCPLGLEMGRDYDSDDMCNTTICPNKTYYECQRYAGFDPSNNMLLVPVDDEKEKS